MEQAKGSKRQARGGGPSTAAAVPVPVPTAVVEAEAEDAAEGREWLNARASAQATRAANARQVSGRRRFVDPTTCEREYSVAEMEFMTAMHEYKKSSGRMFPTWSEVLEVLKALGYEKVSALELADSLADRPVPARIA